MFRVPLRRGKDTPLRSFTNISPLGGRWNSSTWSRLTIALRCTRKKRFGSSFAWRFFMLWRSRCDFSSVYSRMCFPRDCIHWMSSIRISTNFSSSSTANLCTNCRREIPDSSGTQPSATCRSVRARKILDFARSSAVSKRSARPIALIRSSRRKATVSVGPESRTEAGGNCLLDTAIVCGSSLAVGLQY
jgi:hypothetical protein